MQIHHVSLCQNIMLLYIEKNLIALHSSEEIIKYQLFVWEDFVFLRNI